MDDVTLYGDGSILSPNRTWPRFSEGRFEVCSEQKSNLYKKKGQTAKEKPTLFNTTDAVALATPKIDMLQIEKKNLTGNYSMYTF